MKEITMLTDGRSDERPMGRAGWVMPAEDRPSVEEVYAMLDPEHKE